MLAITVCAIMNLAPAPIPVVLSSDLGCEIDDQWALAHLVLSPAIDLRCVVTSHAPNLNPPAAESSARLVGEILMRTKPQRGTVPRVVAGSSVPLAAEGQPRRGPGVDALIEASRGFTPDRRLQVVMIGAATDVASALLIDPTWADRVRVVAMGFDDWPAGGDPWNVKNDPIAWRTVLRSKVPLVIAGSKVCKDALVLSGDDLSRRFGGKGEPGPSLVKSSREWLVKNAAMVKSVSSRPDAWPLWDSSTVAVLLGKTESKTYPRPDLKDDLSFDHTRPQGTLEWVTRIDGLAVWDDLERCMRKD